MIGVDGSLDHASTFPPFALHLCFCVEGKATYLSWYLRMYAYAFRKLAITRA